MTKAERDKLRSSRSSVWWKVDDDGKLLWAALNHIDALEAQLREKDERIRVMHATIRANVRPKALAEWLIETDAADRLAVPDAKGGEGK